MTALDWVLVVAIIVLAAFVAAGLVLGSRALRQLQTTKDEARHSQDQAVDDAQAKVDDAKAKAASVRAEAAAAKAEASAARAEARRVLEAAHEEADTILEHAHRQAEADAEQVRTAARRSGEREVSLLNATAKEQAAEVERRAARIDERERLHGEEVERLVQRERRLAAMDADLAGTLLALSLGLRLQVADEDRGVPAGALLDRLEQLGPGVGGGEAGDALQLPLVLALPGGEPGLPLGERLLRLGQLGVALLDPAHRRGDPLLALGPPGRRWVR